MGTDKFSKLLQNCHNSLAALLEVCTECMIATVPLHTCTSTYQMATTEDVGKHVEEILSYVSYTVKVDPAGGLLCVQQVRL